MKTYNKQMFSALLAVVLLFALSFVATANEEVEVEGNEAVSVETMMTVTGFVNDYYQIESEDGSIYDIGVGEVGDELIQHTGERVKVSGNVVDEEGELTITVTSFKVITE